MNKFNIITGAAILLLAIGLGLVYFAQPSPQVIKEVIKEVGAMPGNELPGPAFIVGGVESFYASMAMTKATTTICRLRAPSATSTLTHFSVHFDTSTSTGNSRIYIAKTTNALSYATTTQIGQTYVLPATAKETIVASTTAAQLANATLIFAPNDWIVASMVNNEGHAGLAPIGQCKAEWRLVK